MFPTRRMRRLRRDGVREMVSETDLSTNDLIAPLFVDATTSEAFEIPSMPNQYRYPISDVADRAVELHELGIPAIVLFGVPESKDPEGSRAYADDGVVQEATRRIKDRAPDLLVITDLCMCEYTDHGHCGILEEGEHNTTTVDNDATLPYLRRIAVSQARAGADMVAPSGMIDGMVGAIREGLDDEGFEDVGVLSYAVKYASNFYGPFRDAADSAPSLGDRRHYQMNPPNVRLAIEEAELDVKEGADVLMVKPALPYLDVINRVRNEFDLPLAAYNVSGEYAMLKAAGEKGWLNAEKTAYESLVSIKRAGADMILTYFAEEVARKL
ncbi:MAG: porphobilinogen synthase [Halobacteria archaeon]|nr:porphobilinogen synthase [Halobacteria archaeon]